MSVYEKYVGLTPTSKRIYERATRVLPSGNTRGVIFYNPYPAYAKRGRGSRIWDVDGNERIDFCFNYTVLVLGHNHPKVMKAVKEQLEYGTVLGAPTEVEVELAEKIVEKVPCAEMVRFTGTGTEAVINALRVARAYTGKNKIGKFEGGFHGTSDGIWISTNPPIDLAGPAMKPKAVPESEGIPNEVVENVVVMSFNNARMTEEMIKKHKNELAAVIVEPVLGGRGISAEKEFLKGLREVTQKCDVLLIFDEVQTGFRLAPGGGQEYFDVKPDMSVHGKIIGHGFPIGAFAASEEIMEICAFPEVEFPRVKKPRVPSSGTFNAHPIAMAAGLAALNELDLQAYEHMNSIGQDMRTGLTKILNDTNIKGLVTGIGSYFHVHFTEEEEVTDYRTSLDDDVTILRYFDIDLLAGGVYLAPGHACNVSVVTTEKDIKQALQAMEQSLRTLKPIIRKNSPNLIRK